MADSVNVQEEEGQRTRFRELYRRSEAKLATLFGGDPAAEQSLDQDDSAQASQLLEEQSSAEPKKEPPPPKKPARAIDEDNYDDDDEDEDENEQQASPTKGRGAHTLLSPSKSGSSPIQSDLSPVKNTEQHKEDAAEAQPKTSEDARKQLEEEKKAVEDAAKRSFHTLFYTLENDRVAMLEQQKLEESEKQIDAEMDNNANANHTSGQPEHGSLSTTNLGASSLTLKHLIARIDQSRDKVLASDAELRTLINEVRKNRSKWASEENVNQEELYEAAEKVLMELKAMTEYSAPFLVRVNKLSIYIFYMLLPWVRTDV
ncbi:Transcriptional activator spt7 protein [Rutstroemia sp. NJR-2017a BBW]|nr:Transcriptional activator spt7 protein [Rutstroemia sp. NJR-2017a BBW]